MLINWKVRKLKYKLIASLLLWSSRITILDSERSNFFVPVIAVLGSKTASIFFNSILFDREVNLVGAFKR